MKILFYADGRSATTRNWLPYWIQRGDEVHLVTSFACEKIPDLASQRIVAAAFSNKKKSSNSTGRKNNRLWGSGLVKARLLIRQWAGPLTIPSSGSALQQIVEEIKPDLVHALRIPYEGMVAAAAGIEAPLVMSVWGSDFIQHARSSPLMGLWTRKAMQAADGLHPDCKRDLRLGREWGFSKKSPSLVIPGNGGIHPSIFHPPNQSVTQPVVVNPRGFRSGIRQDVVFRSAALVLKKVPAAKFLCSAMAGDQDAERWINRLEIKSAVKLLPLKSHADMGDLLRTAAVLVSPSRFDGTPNSVLEGMACGCYPVVGNIESLREWIIEGENGNLVDPGNAEELANAIIKALENRDIRQRALKMNADIISSRADFETCMKRAEEFYNLIVG